jgi:hypothetical protein
MAIWTDSGAGNYQYMGWGDAPHVQFDGLCKQIRKQCQTASSMRLEEMYLTRSCSQLAGQGPRSWCLMGGQVEIKLELYNKFKSEEEDQSILLVHSN